MAQTITVASKLQHGLVLELQTPHETDDVDRFGHVRKVTRWVKNGKTVTINGASVPIGDVHTKHIVAGAALTHGVDKSFWDEWVKQNENFPALKNGMIFVQSTPAKAEAQSKERAEVKVGNEPLDPDNLPSEFRGPKGKPLVEKRN